MAQGSGGYGKPPYGWGRRWESSSSSYSSSDVQTTDDEYEYDDEYDSQGLAISIRTFSAPCLAAALSA